MLGGRYAEILGRVAQVLGDLKIPWALIGGAALPARGRVRGTRDLDVLIVADASDVSLLARHLQEAGFAHHPRADVHPLERVVLYRFWFPVAPAASSGVDVQVAKDPYLGDVVQRATVLAVAGTGVPVATAEDLVLLKLLSFRPIDRADAVELAALASPFDEPYVERRAGELGIGERWQEVREAAREMRNGTD